MVAKYYQKKNKEMLQRTAPRNYQSLSQDEKRKAIICSGTIQKDF